MADEDSESYFDAERPISHLEDDLLGRGGFAGAVAEAIRGWRGKDSLVVALMGDWGSGKSSIKNMVIDYFSKSRENAPVIVEFNPWEWASQKRITQAFFDELSVAVGKRDSTGDNRKRARRWRLYARALSVGNVGLTGLNKTILITLALIGATGITFINSSVIRIVVLVLCVAIVILGWATHLFDSLSQWFSELAGFQHLPITEQKRELRSDIRRCNQTILVVCDDIDRLTASETRLLMQLVKANGDFPNIVYLLLFQRGIVEAHLSEPQEHGVIGKDYLDKIVQVPFNVPKIESARVEEILTDRINAIFGEDPRLASRFDAFRWGNLYYGGLQEYFETLRDVYRYVSVLAFHVSHFTGKLTIEVNPVDLIGIETLRVFEPELYRKILTSKDDLTNVSLSSARRDQEAIANEINTLLEVVDESRRKAARAILSELFPPVKWIWGGLRYGPDNLEEWERQLRICHERFFDRYFLFAIPQGDLSQSDLEEIIATSDSRTGFVSKCRQLRENGLLNAMLSALESYKMEIPIKNAEEFVGALFDITDMVSGKDREARTMLTPYDHVWRIIYWYLHKVVSQRERADVLMNALNTSSSLAILPSVLYFITREDTNGNDKDGKLIADEDIEALKKRWVERVADLAKQKGNPLATSPHVVRILVDWKDWGDKNTIRDWVERTIGDPGSLRMLLVALTDKVVTTTMGDHVSAITWKFQREVLDGIVDKQRLEQAVADLDRGQLSDGEKVVLKAVGEAFE